MRQVKHILLCLLLCLSLTAEVFAADVPESFVCENLNGQQRIIKTYVLPANGDADALREAPFTYEGYRYTWAYTTKEEHPYSIVKTVTETVEIETAKDDLAQILAQLAPSMTYDDGEYVGELALDHTTLKTVAAGYETRYSSISETKTISGLASNDMSYVPGTTVKNGKTLKLANVEWQVTATGLVGEELLPCEYQAVATYTGSSSYQAATGYATTAEYTGEVTASGIESITYTVVFTGEKLEPVQIGPAPDEDPAAVRSHSAGSFLAWIACAIFAVGCAFLGWLLWTRRKNVYVYVPGNKPRDYKLVAKYRVEESELCIDITDAAVAPEGNVAVEIKHALAKKVLGKTFTVNYAGKRYCYNVQNDRPGDWHEFNLKTFEEVQLE
jgi:hypothetical protein